MSKNNRWIEEINDLECNLFVDKFKLHICPYGAITSPPLILVSSSSSSSLIVHFLILDWRLGLTNNVYSRVNSSFPFRSSCS